MTNSGKLFPLANGSGLMKICWLLLSLLARRRGRVLSGRLILGEDEAMCIGE